MTPVIFGNARKYPDTTWLSNLSPRFSIRVGPHILRTAEHLYQVLKTTNVDEQRLILAEVDPLQAKKVAGRVTLRGDWERVKVDAMKATLYLKARQNNDVAFNLMQTKGRLIVEESHHDSFWGARWENGSLKGKNTLGALWMDVRDMIAGGIVLGPVRWDFCVLGTHLSEARLPRQHVSDNMVATIVR